jgi:uncharacterized protein YbjT (DUF2867 family)
LFGATGMIGQGVLRECLLDRDVELVLSVGRSPTGQDHAKLREVLRGDLSNLADISAEAAQCDACFFCLGVSSSGMSEKEYERITYGITLAIAGILSQVNPNMTFVYVSGAGADTSERGSSMWARIKGKTENALLRMPFRAVYVFRPAFVQPLHGVRSRTRAYRIFYAIAKPLMPLLRSAFPNYVLTSEGIGLAMLAAARQSAGKRILESKEIRELIP